MAINEAAERQHVVRRRCEHCNGVGTVRVPICGECGEQLATETLDSEEQLQTLACGHTIENLVERAVTCEVCEGRGRVHKQVGEVEFRAFQRKRIVRGMALLVMTLIPVSVLLWAFFSAEPGAVCGSWWYGVVFSIAGVAVGAQI